MRIVLKKRNSAAFSLMEVMIAIAVFFMAIFAILELTSRNLKMARALQSTLVDPGRVASELALTNQLEEGSMSGTFAPDYPDVSWSSTITEASTNGLFLVDILITQPVKGKVVETPLQVLLFRPQGAPQLTAAGTTSASGQQQSSGKSLQTIKR